MVRLNLGSGALPLHGWVNIDISPQPGVDRVLDVTTGLPYSDVEYIYAEHFIEHIDLGAAVRLMEDCRRALRDNGILRLSTPNLDWVWVTHYKTRWKAIDQQRATICPSDWRHDSEAAADCVDLNRAFRAWGHRFLYNHAMLHAALHAAGFSDVQNYAYGESDCGDLRSLERHERYGDLPGLPHVIIVEATGRREYQATDFAALMACFERDLS